MYRSYLEPYWISSGSTNCHSFFGISLLKLGMPLILLLLSLYLFGITLGLLVTSGLVRYGPSFENIAWASLFFIAPIGCIYYPVEILPTGYSPLP